MKDFHWSDAIAVLALIVSVIALWLSSRQWREGQRDRLLATIVDQLTVLRTIQHRLKVALIESARDPQPLQVIARKELDALRDMLRRAEDLDAQGTEAQRLIAALRWWAVWTVLGRTRHETGLNRANAAVMEQQTADLINIVAEKRRRWGDGTFIR